MNFALRTFETLIRQAKKFMVNSGAMDWTQEVPQLTGKSGFWYSGGQGVSVECQSDKNTREC